jgi:membrane-associated phospholipid phosphatase
MEADSLSFRQRLVQALLGSLIITAGLGSYLAVLKWRGAAAVLDTQTAWDRLIPFQPGWLYVYLAPYAIAPVIFGLMRRGTFIWFLKRALLILAVSLLVFAVVPTQTVRPPVDDLDDGWTAKLYRAIVAIDQPPANAAPSLHVSLTCLLAIVLLRDFPRWRPVISGGLALVWLATLFTWQHHLIDVATGALLGLVASLPFPKDRFSLTP